MKICSRWIVLIAIALLCVSCAGIDTVKTTITIQDDVVVEVDSKHNALVSFKGDNIEGVVDNRGAEGFWKGLLQYFLVKPAISLGK